MSGPNKNRRLKIKTKISEVKGVSFGVLTDEDVLKLSVKRIDSPNTFDSLMKPISSGLYDPALGVTKNTEMYAQAPEKIMKEAMKLSELLNVPSCLLPSSTSCPTCNLNGDYCPGHIGHVEVPLPLYNPAVFPRLYQMLKLICLHCHHFRMHRDKLAKIVKIIKLVSANQFDEAMAAEAELDGLSVGQAEKKSKKKAKKRGDSSSEDEMEESEEEEEASSDPRRSGLTRSSFDTIRRMTERFIKQTPADKCANCGAFAIAIKKDNINTKLFLIRPSKSRLLKMWSAAIRYHYPLPKNGVPPPLPDDVDPYTLFLWNLDEQRGLESEKKERESSSDDSDNEKKDEEGENSDDEEKKRKEKEKKKKQKQKQATQAPGIKPTKDKIDPNTQQFLHPLETEAHIHMLWEQEKEAADTLFASLVQQDGKIYRESKPGLFFQRVIAVPPNRFRPASVVGEIMTEHSRNVHLGALITLSSRFHSVFFYDEEAPTKRKKTGQKNDFVRPPPPDKPLNVRLDDLGVQMQFALNRLFDNRPDARAGGPNKVTAPGVKQILEKKRGLFRQNMMGKRVNFAGRTVISPDPNIETNQIGVPLYFATRLTYPEPVNAWNVDRLRKMVLNGPKVHPGAVAVEDADGNIVRLNPKNERQRMGIAKTLATPSVSSMYGKTPHGVKRVLRHLVDGDVLIVNRQPTLHKPSMMVHKARVLGKEKTFFMHYANCNTYNADFDGDEMNIHFPQNEQARAEMQTIAITDEQYVVPKDGSPLRGLIQDHIVGGVKLTKRDTFLTRGETQWMLYVACSTINTHERLILPPPAILKPKPLWTGKQVITALLEHMSIGLHPINIRGKEQIPDELWGKGSEESNVVVVNNEFVCGVLGKKQFGLVHAIYELWGPEMAGRTLTALGKLFTAFIQIFSGFTCGMDDLLLTAPVDLNRKKFIQNAEASGIVQAGTFSGILSEDSKTLDDASKKPAIIEKLRDILDSPEESEKWDKFMISHAGGLTTALVDLCLPHGQMKPFPDNNMAMMTISGAKGSRVNQSQISCLLGQQELEGHRPPLMPTGRALPCFEAFDPNPRAGAWVADRFLSGLRPPEYFFHTMAGREGLIDTAVKTSRSGYLQRCIIKHLETLCVHYDYTVRDMSDGTVIQFRYGEDALDVTRTGWLSEFDFLADNCQAILSSYDTAAGTEKLQIVPRKEVKRVKKQLGKKKSPETILSEYSPGTHLGAVSEKFEQKIDDYIAANPGKRFLAGAGPESKKLDPSLFRSAMYFKYAHALAQPGEVVGVLAGQSIGEPSTQMTLNTFHLAGHGDVNVTLGIPRMRELIMTAGKNIKTPSMILQVRPEVTKERALKLVNQLSRIMLGDIHQQTRVKEYLKSDGGDYHRVYEVEVEFIEADKKLDMSRKEMFSRLNEKFIHELLVRVHADLKVKRQNVGNAGDLYKFTDTLASTIARGDDDDEAGEAEAATEARETRASNNRRDLDADGTTGHSVKQRGRDDDDDEEDGPDNDEASTASDDETNDGDEDLKKKYNSDFLKALDVNPGKLLISFTLSINADKPKLLIVEMVDRLCQTLVIRGIPGIRKAAMLKPDKNEPNVIKLQTQGINFPQAWRMHAIVDPNKLYSNDVHQLREHYGIEAARNAILHEISSVFKAYGITVDRRHLSLVADYMTRDGVVSAMSRAGFANNTSPFLKMTYETSVKFLADAAFTGEFDRMSTASSQICLGKPVTFGSGMVDVRYDTTFQLPSHGLPSFSASEAE